MSLGATASDNVGVDRVEFKVRGVVVATDTSAPFSANFDTKTVADGAAAWSPPPSTPPGSPPRRRP